MHCSEKQVYINLGTLLLCSAELEIDSLAMEGFNASILDGELQRTNKGLSFTRIIALGYRLESDFNADLLKSRLPKDELIERI